MIILIISHYFELVANGLIFKLKKCELKSVALTCPVMTIGVAII